MNPPAPVDLSLRPTSRRPSCSSCGKGAGPESPGRRRPPRPAAAVPSSPAGILQQRHFPLRGPLDVVHQVLAPTDQPWGLGQGSSCRSPRTGFAYRDAVAVGCGPHHRHPLPFKTGSDWDYQPAPDTGRISPSILASIRIQTLESGRHFLPPAHMGAGQVGEPVVDDQNLREALRPLVFSDPSRAPVPSPVSGWPGPWRW